MCLCVGMCTWVKVPLDTEVLDFPGAGITGNGCDLPNLGPLREDLSRFSSPAAPMLWRILHGTVTPGRQALLYFINEDAWSERG